MTPAHVLCPKLKQNLVILVFSPRCQRLLCYSGVVVKVLLLQQLPQTVSDFCSCCAGSLRITRAAVENVISLFLLSYI